MTRMIVATSNAGKIRELREMFTNYELVGLSDLPKVPEINEDGTTFIENATIKARTVFDMYPDDYVLADDSGLSIDYLDGRPGILSARYAGDHDDQANIDKVLTELAGVPQEKRKAHFTSSLVLLRPGQKKVVAIGETHGYILEQREGDGGFGYDPIFYSTELKKPFGLATSEEKNSVSHRHKALEALKKHL